MNRIVYLNGEYMAPEQAKISIFDRGVLFGDAVYEVVGVLGGRLLDFAHHMARLESSLGKLSIPPPIDREGILAAFRELIRRNGIMEGLVYVQITRGREERDFVHGTDLRPTVFMFTQVTASSTSPYVESGVSLQSVPDIRWARRDIKTVNLLGQVLAKQAAHDSGAYEALMVDPDGHVTECGATSFFMFRDKTIITRPLSNDILPGVTRRAVVALCKRDQIGLEERPFTLEEACEAEEAFITGASTFVMPVTRIDGRTIGNGVPGPATMAMRVIYLDYARETAI